MKALILSGGKGTRLRPITFTSAKQLIPVANKPILFYGIEAIVSAGISDIGIIVGETHEEIKAAVGSGKKWGAKVTYIYQEEPLGLAHAVKIAEPFLKDSRFVMYLGDNIIKDGINALAREFEKNRPNSQILLAHVPNPSQFGVAELKSGRIVCLEEKPKKPRSDLALVGVYMFDSSIFRAVNAIKPSRRNEYEITDAISWLIDNGYTVEPHIIEGWWKDTGKLEDLLEANRIMLEIYEREVKGKVDRYSSVEGRVVVDKGARIIGSVVRGPAIVGSGAVIRDSYIGPFTSIGRRVEITNSEVEHSIVLDDAQIENLGRRMEGSLIGKNAKVKKSDGLPAAYRFMLGDNSEVGVL
ncbi:MAG: glucose-1-phosphate thymidylyltransferase [bacterium]